MDRDGPVASVIEIFSGIQGEGPLLGVRQIFVRIAGCNLDCDYCDTPGAPGFSDDAKVENVAGSMEFKSISNPLAADVAAAEISRLAQQTPHHSIAWTGGEPLWSTGYLREVIGQLKSGGVKQYLETNGTLPDKMAEVADLFDYVSADIKLPRLARGINDMSACRKFLSVVREHSLDGCAKLVFDDAITSDELDEAAEIAAESGMILILQPVSPTNDGPSAPSASKILEVQSRALKKLSDVRVIPQIHTALGLL